MQDRICKCGNAIPHNIVVNGVYKKVRKRKACFECLPFGNAYLRLPIGTDKKENERARWRRSHKKRRHLLKQKAIEYKGNKCLNCDYDKCKRALEFHHIDPEEKDFGIAYAGNYKEWDEIKVELDKCICLCANCHREAEDGLLSMDELLIKENNRKKDFYIIICILDNY